jgi:hypothetical protein
VFWSSEDAARFDAAVARMYPRTGKSSPCTRYLAEARAGMCQDPRSLFVRAHDANRELRALMTCAAPSAEAAVRGREDRFREAVKDLFESAAALALVGYGDPEAAEAELASLARLA